MKRHMRFLLASAALFLSASLLSAQEDNSKPRPAAREYPPVIQGLGELDSNGDQGSTINLNPDTRPLTGVQNRSEEHTSELQSHSDLVCRLLLEKKNTHAEWQAPHHPYPRDGHWHPPAGGQHCTRPNARHRVLS